MKPLKYPIGIQDFREIREQGYHYLDKTKHIYGLLTEGKYYFLSRPRRFGKSLLVATIKEIYQGSEALFEGLWIERQWDWSRRYPVAHLAFSSVNYHQLGLAAALSKEIERIAEAYGLRLKSQELKDQFRELLETLAQKRGRVVLLIDEYDKPIIDYIEKPEQAKHNREILRQFYAILKDADPHLEFALITGVSKFSKVSIFSDLNNLEDITMSPAHSTLLGITPDELEQQFGTMLDQMEAEAPTIRQQIRQMYNGYSWDGQNRVYNPFSLLRFLKSKSLQNYWFETGTPTFLVQMMYRQGRFKWDPEAFVSLLALNNFDEEHMDLQAVLFQTGYLSIATLNVPEGWCKLDYPNQEVRTSLEQLLLAVYQHQHESSGLPTVLQLREALEKNDLEQVVQIVNAVFAQIPYDLWREATALHYHALVHLTFSLLSSYLKSELHSALGRCDALVQTATHIYAFEFKLEQNTSLAIQQIIDKGYLAPYQLDSRSKIAVGINFSREKRGISAVEWRQI